MTTPNMTKQYRAELRDLNKNRRGVFRDLTTEVKVNRRIIRVAEANLSRSNKACDRALTKIDRRIAILKGRLGL